jgi:ketosteroid isomerase-like protein/catechol 2,3-dioxygenase-like lactoylglutathione lyase family enzyme
MYVSDAVWMSEGAADRVARVRDTLSALQRDDLDAVDALLADDVRWTGMPPGPGDCLNRREVRGMLASWYEEGAFGTAEVFAVELHRVGVAMSRDGVETVHVLTFAGDRVIAVQACRDRAAIDALPAPDPPTAGGAATADATSRPEALAPFVRVADIERSIAFYETLGFEVTDTHRHAGRIDWAALRSGAAWLMLAQAGPVDPAAQGVLLYLYSRDLAALRETLVRAGVAVTAIGDGSPGPRQEMRVADPDGYCLMVAQIERG